MTIHKEVAIKHLLNKKRIAINHNDTRLLKDLIDEKEQNYFLSDMTQHESECVLNEEWLTWTDTHWNLPQIEYYNSLKTDAERKIYADASGQQYALNLLFSPIHKGIDTYDLEHFNTFFENIEFYYNNNIDHDKNEYLTSLNVKELWLPAAHFNLDDDTETKTVNGIEFIQIDDAVEQYSFTSNRVRYDSNWYSDFLIKL